MCGPDDRFFSGAQRCCAILEPNACDAFRACEQTVLRCMCSVYGCTVYILWGGVAEMDSTIVSLQARFSSLSFSGVPACVSVSAGDAEPLAFRERGGKGTACCHLHAAASRNGSHVIRDHLDAIS